MELNTFFDNHLRVLTYEQADELFDFDAVAALGSGESERQYVFWLSQYVVGNIEQPFAEISRLGIFEQQCVMMTWTKVIKDAPTLRRLVLNAVHYLN